MANEDKKNIKKAFKELLSSDKRVIEIEISDKKNINIRPIRTLFNKFVVMLTKKMTPMELKNSLFRMIGLNIGKDACIPMYNHFDCYFPELITIKEGTLVGGMSEYYSHEFVEKDGKLILRLGKVFIDKECLISGMARLYPGAYVRKNCIVGLYTHMVGETQEGEFWGASEGRLLKKFSKEEIDSYFKFADEDSKEYYKKAKKMQDDFRKNKEERLIRFTYAGKRGNAGMDWWRARNVLRIYFNGVVIEFFNLLGIHFLKLMAFRMLGTKIGKNFKISRGTVPDHIHPEYVTIGNNVRMGKGGYIDAHEYGVNYSMYGRTIIEDDVDMGDVVLFRAGTTIGKGSKIDSHSVVLKDVPAGEHWGGCPAKKIESDAK